MSSSSRSSTTSTTTGGLKTFAVGDRVESARGNEATVYSYEQPAAPADPSGIVFIMNPFDWVLEMPDNTRQQASYGGAAEPQLEGGDVYQGDCIRGFVSFDVPIGVRPVAVRDTAAAPPIRWLVP